MSVILLLFFFFFFAFCLEKIKDGEEDLTDISYGAVEYSMVNF